MLSVVEHLRSSEGGIEKLVTDLQSFLVSKLNSLGYQRHGMERDDLLQEIHIRIWKAYKDDSHNIHYFNAYLKKIINSVFINEINRIKKENNALVMGVESLNQTNGANGRGPAADLSLKNVLVDTLDDLNEPKQRVIKLRLEGFTFGEIAQLNQWSVRKTHGIYYSGIKDLKHKLGERGIHYED
ncbi:MAG: sigma-70 family RNA polymerase sigma factor [Candidatus Aminicenantales bacterium]